MLQKVSNLQSICADSYVDAMENLQIGMSEVDIANILRELLEKQGINQHWYDVPFNVLIGVDRFKVGTTTTDYSLKSPSPDVKLEIGQFVHVDFAPMDPESCLWGDWSSTCVFRPNGEFGKAQVEFLDKMRRLQRTGISQITARTTGADVARYFLDQYEKFEVTLLDVRNNVGHSMHSGPKSEAERIWLDTENANPLGVGLYTVEPGGISRDGMYVARFEDCIYISPAGGASILGITELVPLEF